MTTFDDSARAYIAAWNTEDDAERREAVATAFAPDATYTDPLADVAGHDGIAALIAGAQQQFAGWTFRLAGPVDGHHGQARFTWTLGPDGQEVVVGFDVVRLDDGGRIKEVLGFLDKVPTPSR
ncbi:MAG: nuclear transport factor 2 family protein [Pseudonocardiales bacterium]|nr:nuclear transport factor 2 family protein [Pseudonocardiales bacterium]